MPCPEQILGPEAWFITVAAIAGAVLRLFKWLVPRCPPAVLPFLAMSVGFLVDGLTMVVLCDFTWAPAALGGLGGAFAGLAAAGGHELVSRALAAVVGAPLADRLLGKMRAVHGTRLLKVHTDEDGKVSLR